MQVLLPLIRDVAGLNLITYLRIMTQPLLIAFSTCSNAAALPANLTATEKAQTHPVPGLFLAA